MNFGTLAEKKIQPKPGNGSSYPVLLVDQTVIVSPVKPSKHYRKMDNIYVEEKTFEKIDFSEHALTKGNYEDCKFINCNFANMDFSHISFAECEFHGCNLSMAKTIKTTLNNIRFRDCKLLGIHFENCNDFLLSVSFENCILNFSSFYKLKLKKTAFKNSSLQEVDFTETDLTNSNFDNCDLTRAIFNNSVLERVDFRTAYNYSIDPAINKIKKAKFSVAGIAGLLSKYDIDIDY